MLNRLEYALCYAAIVTFTVGMGVALAIAYVRWELYDGDRRPERETK